MFLLYVGLCLYITKTRLFKYVENFTYVENFQVKNSYVFFKFLLKTKIVGIR